MGRFNPGVSLLGIAIGILLYELYHRNVIPGMGAP